MIFSQRAGILRKQLAQCGGIVNPSIPAAACSEAEHALARRQRFVFCVHCGLRLIASR
jgi:hypothetical protein